MKLVLLSLLCCIIAVTHAQVHFNSSYPCGNGCDITNSSIYIGGVAPTGDQEVFFNVTNILDYLYIPSNSTFNVTALHVWNTALIINDNATIEVIEELYFSQVLLYVTSAAKLVVHEEAEFENSTVFIDGYVHISELSTSLTFILANTGSILQFEDFDFENGSIEVEAGSNFTVHGESEFSYADDVTFYNTPYLGEVEFEYVNAFFPAGFYAENQYVISSSNFTAFFPDALANVSFILAGKNNLNVSNLNFNSDKIKINNTGTPFITFSVSNNATFDGNLSVPGEVVINTGSSVLFNGIVALTGGLIANVDSFTQIIAKGSLTTGKPIDLHGFNINLNDSLTANKVELPLFIVENAVLHTPGLTLDRFRLHSYNGTTIVGGSVVNNGSLHVFDPSNVIVNGNYTQLPNTTFGVFNLDNTANRQPSLFVNGTAVLEGDIKYNTSETKKKFTVTALKAGHGIRGQFATSEFYGDVGKFSPTLVYTQDEVQITITPDSSRSWLGLHWWIWLVIAAGSLAVIVFLIFFIRVVRRRTYEPVSTAY